MRLLHQEMRFFEEGVVLYVNTSYRFKGKDTTFEISCGDLTGRVMSYYIVSVIFTNVSKSLYVKVGLI